MDDCIFCKIAEKKIPSKFIYEDKTTMAFLDINPGAPGHALIIPKKHYETIFEMPESEVSDLFRTTVKVAKAIDKIIGPDGVNIFQNNKTAAGQLVNHAHVHIFPRFHGDGIDFKWRRVVLDDDDLDNIARKIRVGME